MERDTQIQKSESHLRRADGSELSMFLTNEELQMLTGYVRNADRCRWLTNHRWVFVCSISGRPNVSRQYAESMLSGGVQIKKPEPQLNLAAISKR